MLCIQARKNNKIKLLRLSFGQVKKKNIVATGEQTVNMMSKCQMGELCLSKKAEERPVILQWSYSYLCADGVRGHLVAPLSSGHQTGVKCVCTFVCAQGCVDMLLLMFTESISAKLTLTSGPSIYRLTEKLMKTSHRLLQR